jgi:hypothetical protein
MLALAAIIFVLMMFIFRLGDHFDCLDRFQEIRAYPLPGIRSPKTKAKRRPSGASSGQWRRLMFGSDWPVVKLRGGYSNVWHETNLAIARLSRDERDWILGGTATAFYRLPIHGSSP